jgi:hypothetical protein
MPSNGVRFLVTRNIKSSDLTPARRQGARERPDRVRLAVLAALALTIR